MGRAKAIMIQGTASNAGKSLLATGLCRILRQDGYRVAPFKSQNMALNSFITLEGLEMGRAQVTQAEAAGTAPSALMNPVLLKPHSDTGSQVIVNGEIWGVMPAGEYYQRKSELVPIIEKAYHTLSEQYDVVVLEGAGSPAEINLKHNDIVNMGMAKMANAPVLLAGDIDCGGVFAALYGTMMLLDKSERRHVKGLIINKFRGDRAILQPGLEMLESLVQRPIVGVVPWCHAQIDGEDSLSVRLTRKTARPGAPDIAVIRLPRIANFTDFAALEMSEALSVRYIEVPGEWGSPDLIVVPGSKNTMEDLLWLRQSGLESMIKKHAAAGGAVFGICGGYQMLGQTLLDSDGIERKGELQGLSLLPVHTVFTEEKRRTRVSGRLMELPGEWAALSGQPLEGYEIHMGETTRTGGVPLCEITDLVSGAARQDGCAVGNVCGCYVHGVFDKRELLAALTDRLCQKKGVLQRVGVDPAAFRESQYDILADTLRESLDMKAVYRIINEGMGE